MTESYKSENFLGELSAEDLQQEYRNTKARFEEHIAFLNHEVAAVSKSPDPLASPDKKKNAETVEKSEDMLTSEHIHQYFLQRLKLKKQQIKDQLTKLMAS